jgi:signal transduction histidine kinase
VEEAGEALYAEVSGRGLEGILAKRSDSPYRGGRSPHWLKLRAAQEALANVSKHARASEVTLTLSYMNDVVALDIQDNGLGFDQALAAFSPNGDNFGLVAMRQRVEQWGGTLTIESVPQEGTTLAIEIPLDKEPA